jgi:pimeloyl-ACP methyl ester carboxylesterase
MSPARVSVAAILLLFGGRALVSTPPPTDPVPGAALADGDGRFAAHLGIEVHHRRWGSDHRPTVLLLHHFYGSVATWRHVAGDLAPDHHVLAYDRPGFGLTERPPRSRWNGTHPYTRDTSARIGLSLLDAAAAEEAVLIGASAGGTTALEIYRHAPERVRALVLISPAITGDIGPPGFLRPALRLPPANRIGPAAIRRLAGEVTAERVGGGWHDPSRVTTADVDAYARPLRVDGWNVGLWEAMTAEPPPDLRQALPRIEVPTLVVVGASDQVISPRWNRRTAAAIPGARLEVLADCGHTPHEECPERLMPVIRRFLDEVAG